MSLVQEAMMSNPVGGIAPVRRVGYIEPIPYRVLSLYSWTSKSGNRFLRVISEAPMEWEGMKIDESHRYLHEDIPYSDVIDDCYAWFDRECI